MSKHINDVVIRPVVTEKTAHLSEQNKVVFYVRTGVTKEELKACVERHYNVRVSKVNILAANSKMKAFKGRPRVKTTPKKAIITLAEGSSIAFQ